MDISNLKNSLFTKKSTDYTFTVLFLIIFSVFIVFAIRPSLTTAFSLKKEEKDLLKVDKVYEDQIISIATIQSLMEENRGDIPLLYQSISTSPQVNKMVDDVQLAAGKSSFIIKRANIGEVSLFQSKKKTIQSLKMTVEGESNFENFTKFIQELFNQRRLKTVQKVIISQGLEDDVSTQSALLKIKLDVEGYYL